MPELPEVQTTVDGLNKILPRLEFVSVWSAYDSAYHRGKENIKDKKYFLKFKKKILHSPVKNIERKGKNILVHLKSGVTILIHMKMTGHLLYGKYRRDTNTQMRTNDTNEAWVATSEGPLQDPFNRHIRLVFELSNGKCLALSDMRKFAKVMFIKTKDLQTHNDTKGIAPDPFDLTRDEFIQRILRKKSGRIKNVLMDQSIVSGIGNIYSDETLYETGVHPERDISKISDKKLAEIYREVKKILKKGINLGGDSTSDYRNIDGKPGNFQKKHQVYRRTGEKCRRSRVSPRDRRSRAMSRDRKKECGGTIKRKIVGGRSAHFCPVHQKI